MRSGLGYLGFVFFSGSYALSQPTGTETVISSIVNDIYVAFFAFGLTRKIGTLIFYT
jgi:hypothetical protein